MLNRSRLRDCLSRSRGLPSDSTCFLEAKHGKLDKKRREPGILFINLQLVSEYDQEISQSQTADITMAPRG